MELSGKIIQILPAESGEGRNGPWKKQNFVVETQEKYPKKVCITVWGDKIDLNAYSENDMVTASINIESREYNGRWYTDVKAWRLSRSEEPGAQAQDTGKIPSESEPPPEVMDDPSDDLPF